MLHTSPHGGVHCIYNVSTHVLYELTWSKNSVSTSNIKPEVVCPRLRVYKYMRKSLYIY